MLPIICLSVAVRLLAFAFIALAAACAFFRTVSRKSFDCPVATYTDTFLPSILTCPRTSNFIVRAFFFSSSDWLAGSFSPPVGSMYFSGLLYA